MSYQSITKTSYEATATEFANKVSQLAPLASIEKFVRLLPPHAKMIDIGCGSGRDAKIFTDKGLEVTGVDFCANLIAIARKEAPLAEFQVMDMESLNFPPCSFDGAWAACSLIHIPKENFPSVLSRIHSLLKEKGYFYLTLKQGRGEVLEKDLRYGDFEKFWSFFEEEELKSLLTAAKFHIVEFAVIETRTEYQTHPCLRAFCQKGK